MLIRFLCLKILFLVTFTLQIFAAAVTDSTFDILNLQTNVPSSFPVGTNILFRIVSDTRKIDALYARDLHYNETDLLNLEDSSEKNFIWRIPSDKGKNRFGVKFFGIWRYIGGLGEYEHKTVEVFLKNVEAGEWEDASPSIIWRTSCDKLSVDPDPEGIKSIISEGHTDGKFVAFLDDSKQDKLWKYFMRKSASIIGKEEELKLVGFRCISTNDTCNQCFIGLHKFKEDFTTTLAKLTENIKKGREYPVPFLLIMHSKSLYGNRNPVDPSKFKTHFDPSELRHGATFYEIGKIDDEDDECSGKHCKVRHIEGKIKLKEYDQPAFIVYQIKDGTGVVRACV